MAVRKNKKSIRSSRSHTSRSRSFKSSKKVGFVFEQTHLLFFGVVLVVTALFMLIGSFISPQDRPFYLSYADSRDLEAKVVTHEAATQQAFTDVTSKITNYKAIAYLKDKKILGGYQDGSFRPTYPIDRASFSKALVAALNVHPSAVTYHDCAKDVRNEWFAPSMCYLKSKNFMKGYADGGLHPESNIKKSEFLKIVIVAFAGDPKKDKPVRQFKDVPSDQWFAPYVWFAQNSGLLEENPAKDSYNPNSDATRRQVAEVLYRAMTHFQPSI